MNIKPKEIYLNLATVIIVSIIGNIPILLIDDSLLKSINIPAIYCLLIGMAYGFIYVYFLYDRIYKFLSTKIFKM